MVEFLNFICNSSAPHIPILFIVFELLLLYLHRMLIDKFLISTVIRVLLLCMTARIEAANRSDTINGDLL